jgi:hypothetical protein
MTTPATHPWRWRAAILLALLLWLGGAALVVSIPPQFADRGRDVLLKPILAGVRPLLADASGPEQTPGEQPATVAAPKIPTSEVTGVQEKPASLPASAIQDRVRQRILSITGAEWYSASELDRKEMATTIADWMHPHETAAIRAVWAGRYFAELNTLSLRPSAKSGKIIDWLPALHAIMLHTGENSGSAGMAINARKD